MRVPCVDSTGHEDTQPTLRVTIRKFLRLPLREAHLHRPGPAGATMSKSHRSGTVARPCLCFNAECEKLRYAHANKQRFSVPSGMSNHNRARAKAIVNGKGLKLPAAKVRWLWAPHAPATSMRGSLGRATADGDGSFIVPELLPAEKENPEGRGRGDSSAILPVSLLARRHVHAGRRPQQADQGLREAQEVAAPTGVSRGATGARRTKRGAAGGG